MGHLVELPIRQAPARSVEPGHSAAILFFTGVRYHRMPDTPPQPCEARRPRSGKRRVTPASASELQA